MAVRRRTRRSWTLNYFYTAHAADLDRLFVEHIAALRGQGLIALRRVTQDGRKVVADAGRTVPSPGDAGAALGRGRTRGRRPAQPARRPCAADRKPPRSGRGMPAARLRRAAAQVRQRQEQRRASKRSDAEPAEARALESDPDAARMRRLDAAFSWPTTCTGDRYGHGLIVATAAVDQGSDNRQSRPMMEQVHREQGQRPQAVIADAGYSDAEDVEVLETEGVTVYMPPRDERRAGGGRTPRRSDGTRRVGAPRSRTATEAAPRSIATRPRWREGVHAQAVQRAAAVSACALGG